MILEVLGSGERFELRPRRLVVAGYTARDEAAARAHIAELAEIGVPPPPSVPTFYDLDPALLRADREVEVPGPATSGEVEPVVVRHGGRLFLGVGSDHTDRELERRDIGAAKAACPKPVGPSVVPLDGLDWDAVTAESTVDGVVYQRGSLDTLRRPDELLARMADALGGEDGDLALFCGTFPLLAGGFVYGTEWSLALRLPGGPTLAHEYRATERRAG